MFFQKLLLLLLRRKQTQLYCTDNITRHTYAIHQYVLVSVNFFKEHGQEILYPVGYLLKICYLGIMFTFEHNKRFECNFGVISEVPATAAHQQLTQNEIVDTFDN